MPTKQIILEKYVQIFIQKAFEAQNASFISKVGFFLSAKVENGQFFFLCFAKTFVLPFPVCGFRLSLSHTRHRLCQDDECQGIQARHPRHVLAGLQAQGSRALVYLPDYIQNGRHRWHQGQRRLPERYAPQGLPRQDWARVQRVKAGSRRHRQQARARKDPSQEDLRPCWAREALSVPSGVFGPRRVKWREEEGSQRRRQAGCIEETASSAQGGTHSWRQDKRPPTDRTHPLRVHLLSLFRHIRKIHAAYIMKKTPTKPRSDCIVTFGTKWNENQLRRTGNLNLGTTSKYQVLSNEAPNGGCMGVGRICLLLRKRFLA